MSNVNLQKKPIPFKLGKIVATSNAWAVLDQSDVDMAIERHRQNDWGDLCKEDWQLNDAAIIHGGRLFSVYHSAKGHKFYVVTEVDNSVTTLLLPEDY